LGFKNNQILQICQNESKVQFNGVCFIIVKELIKIKIRLKINNSFNKGVCIEDARKANVRHTTAFNDANVMMTLPELPTTM